MSDRASVWTYTASLVFALALLWFLQTDIGEIVGMAALFLVIGWSLVYLVLGGKQEG